MRCPSWITKIFDRYRPQEPLSVTRLAIINESKRVTNAQVDQMVHAIRSQAATYGVKAGLRVPTIGRFSGAPLGSVPLLIVDNPDVANALGYHDVAPNGVPYGRVFVDPVLDNGGSALGATGDPSLSVSAVLSHEVLEWWADPACNTWSDRGRSSIAYELCDPVQGDSYLINGVSVSNAVLPAWFNPLDKTGPYDLMGKLHKPFTMTPGGYWIEMSDGAVHQVFAQILGEATRVAFLAETAVKARGMRTQYRRKAEADS